MHRFITTNGLRLHLVEEGSGPLVILCHGFPESWYSWRHQLTALAAAGYRVVAPDQRGYGQTDRPDAIGDYHILNLTADIVGLVHALGETEAVVIGHDWGSPVAWSCALLRPDIFRAVGLLSVPYLQRQWTDPRPTDGMKLISGPHGEFYQLYFQEPGRAEALLERDIRRTLTLFLYSASGDAPPEQRWTPFVREDTFAAAPFPERLPAWLTEADIDFYVGEFTRTGFRGGLNWYRNLDRWWELTSFLVGAPIRQPALFVAGEDDGVISMYRAAYDALPTTMPGLRTNVLLPDVGHWVQQERPAEVNRLLVEFLRGL